MPRNSSGTFTLPLAPVVSGTIIESVWANTSMDDIAAALTDSLSRSGQGGMIAPFRLVNGSAALPSLAFNAEPNTGMYLAGLGDLSFSVQGAQALSLSTALATFYKTPSWGGMPADPNDLTNKAYVDAAVSGVPIGNYLPLTGGTVTGPISWAGPPTLPAHLTNKAYVDAAIVSGPVGVYLPLTGGTITGDLTVDDDLTVSGDFNARMRQLVGTPAEWAGNDIVLGDGELAFGRDPGYVLMKLGDGVKKYSELPDLLADAPNFVFASTYGAIGNGIADDTAALNAAVAATPLGGTLILRGIAGNVFHTAVGWTVTRSRIAIVGDLMPRRATDNFSLIGGTVIKGQMLVDGDDIYLSRFGVDFGNTYSNTYRAGNGGNGLVVHDAALATQRQNIVVRDVIGLCRIGDFSDPQAAFHAVLLEGLEGGGCYNVIGVGGWYGVVMKVRNWTFDGVQGWNNDNVAVYLKSNSYGPVSQVVGSNVIVVAGGSRCYVGFNVAASDSQLSNVSVDGVTVLGGGPGAAVQIEGEVTTPVVNARITGITTRATVNGVRIRGPVYAAHVEGVVDLPSSGLGFSVESNLGGTPVSDCSADLRINSNVAAVNQVSITSPNAKVELVRIAATVGYTETGNILVTNTTRIGAIIGKLSCDRTEANLLNGWAPFVAGQLCGTFTRNGVTQGYGRIKAGAATSDIFMALPGGAFPVANAPFMTAITGYDGATGKPMLAYVNVAVNGGLSISPNRAAYAANIGFYDLDSLRFPALLPVAGAI